MSALAIVDTNIVLNLINVPHHCAERCAVKDEFDRFNTSNYSFLLPIAAIIETGNHIADIPDGRQRRKYAEIFVGQVREVFDGAAPWRPTDFLTKAEMAGWLATFPDHAMRGLGVSDVSIIQEWERARARHPNRRVFIWTLHNELKGYDQPAR